MHALAQSVILGILTGGVYALMASGQTLIFGIMKVVNLAQGAMVIMAAYLTYQLFTWWGIDPFLSIPITTVIMFGVGVAVEFFLLRPLRREDRSELSLLVTFAVALLIEGCLTLVWSPTPVTVKTSYQNSSWVVFGYHIVAVKLYGFVLSIVMLGILYLLLNKTRFGRAIRATVQNPESARLLGVEPSRVSAIGFGVGAATAGAAGAVFAMLNQFNPNSHYDLISFLLSIILLGGLGSIGGAVVGAIIISVSYQVVMVYSPAWAPMTYFVIIILVLLFRPQGLFGKVGRGAI